VTGAFHWDEAPHHLIRDRDGAFGPAYTRRIRAMGTRDHPTAPRSPGQDGHVERLVGSIRRESLDHVEDDADVRSSLVEILGELDYGVIEAPNVPALFGNLTRIPISGFCLRTLACRAG
jgi:hypothetical protein